MGDILQLPDWLGGAMIGAIIAAIGYVVKLILSWWGDAIATYRSNKASLVELYSMLCASKVAFDYQKEIRDRLHDLLAQRDKNLVSDDGGYERDFSNAYQSMTPEEKELHSIIKAYTIHALFPVNTDILEWLKKDIYFKSKKIPLKDGEYLSDLLSELEGHMILWVAKYKMWIPDQSHHALVYLADENEHGLGFPTGIEELVKGVIDRKCMSHG